jgi:hypothetical protein
MYPSLSYQHEAWFISRQKIFHLESYRGLKTYSTLGNQIVVGVDFRTFWGQY